MAIPKNTVPPGGYATEPSTPNRTGRMLTEQQLNVLVNSFPPIHMNSDTTPIQAGYMLGVQAVLNKLREGV